MKVVLAEKPSVARDIAAVLGAKTKRDGYFEGNDYAVTYAFGHLVTLAEPEEMNPEWGGPWRLDKLPMIPEPDKWKYKVQDKTKQQFNVIKKLFVDPATTGIICATDAGREGEHIFRLIYKLSGSKVPVERLWISSLTAEAIKSGMNKLKPGKDFDNLGRAAAARAHADWIVGLNFTRAYTAMNKQLCTIGRVQTPTLNLIVERQAAIDSFESKPFYEVFGTFAPGFVARYVAQPKEKEGEPQSRIEDKAIAEQVVKDVKPIAQASVESVLTQEKRTKPPALYDLLTLQKDANKRFGYTAQETLNIAQSLYEDSKTLSYPRTESRHLSTDMVDELPRILSNVLKASMTSQIARDAFKDEGIVPGGITTSLLKPRLSKAYVDDAKLTDHHAIIPTHNPPPASLSDKQKNIYQLVATRFLSIFLPAEVRDETTAILALGEHRFRARGFVIKEQGWTILEPKTQKKAGAKDKDKDGEDAQQLPPLLKGQNVDKTKIELKERKTNPPKPYDDASLLTAMKNAGQEIDDEDLASYMKQKGLGTPATRAAIIERLLQTGYVERNKKYLAPTEKGKALIYQVHSDLKDVKLTANWEQQLADMQEGKLDSTVFDQDIAGFIVRILPAVASAGGNMPRSASGKNSKGTTDRGKRQVDDTKYPPLGACPQCKHEDGKVRETPKGAGCSRWREGCKFSIWREQRGVKLSDQHIKDLLLKGETEMIKGFKSKDGKTEFEGKLVMTKDFKQILMLEDGTTPETASGSGMAAQGSDEKTYGQCPLCKAGVLKANTKAVGCNRWREGCKFTIWKEVAGLPLSEEHLTALIENGRTGMIKGFKKKSGTGTFDACLVMGQDHRVKFDFDGPRSEG
ncbi:MAG: DNA topoisomerase 3 [Candidatus Obscuribacterales bacterium]|jgi:DNA topoisomerase-3|nr:DNA topoisomerase 3 [Candidatus Obscuribacterales bacterium]